MDVSKHDRFHAFSGQPGGVRVIELLLLQGGKEALHPGVVVAASGAAHALDQLVAGQGRAEGLAGKLAAPVGVEDGALRTAIPAGLLQGSDTQLRAHIVIHVEALDAAVKAVQHRRQVELAVGTGDLGDIRQKLLIGFFRRKIPLDQVFRLLRLPVRFRQAVGAVLTPDGQVVLPADAADPPGAAGIALV